MIRFTQADLRLFQDASHDRSPLHEDGERARRGPYGGPIVFGGLGVIAAAAALPSGPGSIRRLRATFLRPMFVDVPYSVEIEWEEGPQVAVALTDGRSAVMRAVFGRGEGVIGEAEVYEAVPRSRPASWQPLQLAAAEVDGSYGPAPTPIAELRRRFGLVGKGFDGRLLHGVLFASYLVGMELPGEGSVLSSLRVSLPEGSERPAGSLRYRGSIVELDPELGSAVVAATLEQGGTPVARLSCGAELQARPPAFDPGRLEELLPASDRLAGRTAVVIGAGGAVGAALANGLVSQGCEVHGVVRGQGRNAGLDTRVRTLVGDCTSAAACRRLRESLEAGREGLDLLVCAAAPPIRPLDFHEATGERFLRFVEASLGLLATPLAAFLPALSRRRGCCLYPSTTALATMPSGWDHYLAAKGAGEVLMATVARTWPEVELLVARLPMVSSSRLGAWGKERESVPPEEVSSWLVERMMAERGPGMHLLEWEAGQPRGRERVA